MPAMSYRLVEKQVVFNGSKVRLELHQLQNGQGKRTQREVCVHPGAVVILPLLADGRVVLIRNRRYTLEKGQDPMACAARELVEETGYRAARLKPLGGFYSSPGILTEKLYAFAAYDLRTESTALEEGEEIEVQPTAWDDAIGMIGEGLIQDGKTIATLLMYEKFYRAS